jgi:hypothetical protein
MWIRIPKPKNADPDSKQLLPTWCWVRPEYRKRDPNRGNFGFSFGSGLSSRKKEWCSTQIFHIRLAALHTKHSHFYLFLCRCQRQCKKGTHASHTSLLLNFSAGDPRHFGAHPYLWLSDPDPTPFFSDFKEAKKNFLLIITRRRNVFTL